MSLKAFHILFIALSVLLSIVLSALALYQFTLGGSGLNLVWAVTGIGSAIGLIVYGVRFLRKLRDVSFL
ncbi:MAG: hypothetical protein OEV30_09645 [Ignavibacteria bacterium]|nr:hypothetical protein [Ignavibacteria bacterium]